MAYGGEFIPASGGVTNPYRVEYAKTSRATCTACNEPIGKGELRLGSPTQFGENLGYKWRHWACLTDTVLHNMRNKVERHSQEEAVEGLDAIQPQDQERVLQALETGVREQKETSEEEEEGDSEGEEAVAPPVKTPAKRGRPKSSKPKKKAVKEEYEEVEEEEEEEEEEEGEEEWQPRKESRAARAGRRSGRVRGL